MLKILRTNSENPDFITLVRQLDAYLAKQDGDEHSFYDQFNKINKIRFAIVAYEEAQAVGCGAIREFAPGLMEVKRMYVVPERRSRGIATEVLNALESWAAEMTYEKCILETGKRQPEAVQFYKKNGYTITPQYGPYVGMDNSLCFEKILTSF